MNLTQAATTVGSAIGMREIVKAIESLNLDSVLGVAGLERKPGAFAQLLPIAGLITVSAAVGAGIALLLAPSSGSELRARLSDGLDDAKSRLGDRLGTGLGTTPNNPHAVS